jgi:hypothetical protein
MLLTLVIVLLGLWLFDITAGRAVQVGVSKSSGGSISLAGALSLFDAPPPTL